MITVRCLPLLGALVAIGCAAPAVAELNDAAAPRRPNIIFILADDLGQRDLGVYGSTFYETPNLDRLAASGVRLTDAYAAANVCSPTRASILTGRHPARVGITDWLPGRKSQPGDRLLGPALAAHLGPDDKTFASVLRDAGYQTAFVGKWHLGEDPAHFPDQHGFDVNIAGSGLGHPPSYFSPYRLPNLPDGPAGEHLDERLTREAIAFVRHAAQQPRPFLLYLAHYAVHNPLQAKPGIIAKYQAKLGAHPPAGAEFAQSSDGRVRVVQSNPVYAAMVESLDTSVGAMVAAIDELGIADNTLIVFTSDNGGLSTAEGWPTSNAPLRTGKGWAYEGGVREPLIVRWPHHLPAGAVANAVVTSTDFFPTLLELAGLPLQPETHRDGHSFANVLAHPKSPQPDRPIYWHYPHYSNQRGKPHGAMREGRWKLVEWYENSRVELFDLQTDPGEKRDLSPDEPAVAARMLGALRTWRTEVGAKMPVPNPDYRAAP